MIQIITVLMGKGGNKMANIMLGRCSVECQSDRDCMKPVIMINFLNRKQANSFAYHWTKNNGYYARIFEYQEPNCNNDFKRGYIWIKSYKLGVVVASSNYYYYERVRDGVLKEG